MVGPASFFLLSVGLPVLLDGRIGLLLRLAGRIALLIAAQILDRAGLVFGRELDTMHFDHA